MNTVTINYITYNIVQARTSEDMRLVSYPNTAQAMDDCRILYDLILQRPKGKRFYHAVQYFSGVISRVITLS